MDKSCLQYRLTDEEHDAFETDGYLVVPDAVSPKRIQRISEFCDRLLESRRSAGMDPHAALSEPDIVAKDPVFLEMVDCETVFPKVWGIFGWNVYLYHTHLDVTPPVDPDRDSEEPSAAWHQDSLRVNDEIETSPRPRLSLKIGYFISDVSEPGRGNTLIVPGSQLHDQFPVPDGGESDPSGAIPICVLVGSAVLIDRRTWHSRSLNQSDITRKVLWMGYAYRWLRPKDEMTVEYLFPELGPIRRQILGDRESNNGYYAPTDEDVPLRTWLEKNCPEDAAWSGKAAGGSFRPDIAGVIRPTPAT